MMRHARPLDVIHMGTIHALETALGLPLSTYPLNLGAMWDAIAHACQLPDCDDFLTAHDGPGINVIPHWLWNTAVDIANRKAG